MEPHVSFIPFRISYIKTDKRKFYYVYFTERTYLSGMYLGVNYGRLEYSRTPLYFPNLTQLQTEIAHFLRRIDMSPLDPKAIENAITGKTPEDALNEDSVYKLACMIDFHTQDNGILVKAAIEYQQKHNSLEAIKSILAIREAGRKIRVKEY